MKYIIGGIILLFCIKQLNAQKHDNVWLFGNIGNPSNTIWGGTLMDFNNEPPTLSYFYSETNFMEVNASISDAYGQLQCYTNGLSVANKNHQPMQNGLGLNPGIYANDMSELGYILNQGLIIIPHPDGSNKYFIFHENREYSTLELGGHSSKLYYSLIDMDFNNGLGKVQAKNIAVISDTLDLGKLTAVKHANGRDWWILVNEYRSNEFYRILINPDGVSNFGEISVGEKLPLQSIGQAVFTLDGTKFIRNSLVGYYLDTDYLDIFDFDRCSGMLSNQMRIPYVHGAYAGGVAVSANSRFIYLTHGDETYQFDLWSSNIPASKVTVATYDGFYDSGSSTTFYMAQLAPDGKIYINVPGGVRFLHVIQNPDLPFPYCNMEQHRIQLPTFNNFSLPNFPNYRLGPLDGSPCDTLGLDNHPVAKFRYEQDSFDYRIVHFTNLSYYEPTAWSWQFGDGTSSTEQSPIHTFSSDGAYEVCLTVANQYGINTYCRTLYIGVSALDESEKRQAAKVEVFPNPAQSATNFCIGGHYLPRRAILTLYAATGQPALTQRLAAGWSVVPLEGLAPALYFYEVRDEGRLLGSGKLVRVE